MNTVIETIMSRSSIRAYKTTPLSKEQLRTIIDAALAAPSARNMQPWTVNVLQNKELIDAWEAEIVDFFTKREDKPVVEILSSRKNKIFYDAPCVFVIPVNPQNTYSNMDAGILAQNITLAAKSLGLDSVILGFPSVVFQGENAESWKKKLLFPEGYVYGISVAVGYADMEKDPHELDQEKVIYIP